MDPDTMARVLAAQRSLRDSEQAMTDPRTLAGTGQLRNAELARLQQMRQMQQMMPGMMGQAPLADLTNPMTGLTGAGNAAYDPMAGLASGF